jgi:hypothetical protein
VTPRGRRWEVRSPALLPVQGAGGSLAPAGKTDTSVGGGGNRSRSWLVSIRPGATSGSGSIASGIEAESPQASLRARRLERRARPREAGDAQKLRLTESSTAPEIGAGPEEASKDPLLTLRRRSPLSRLPSPSASLDYSHVGARALFQRRSTGKVGLGGEATRPGTCDSGSSKGELARPCKKTSILFASGTTMSGPTSTWTG